MKSGKHHRLTIRAGLLRAGGAALLRTPFVACLARCYRKPQVKAKCTSNANSHPDQARARTLDYEKFIPGAATLERNWRGGPMNETKVAKNVLPERRPLKFQSARTLFDEHDTAGRHEALDNTLMATFPASDPPAIPGTRIGNPRR